MNNITKYVQKLKGRKPKNEEDEFRYAVIEAFSYLDKDIQKIKKKLGI